MRGKCWIFGLGVILITTMATMASGPSLYEMGSKASAQAGAFVARADDATAIFYNPAGLAFQKGMEFDFNVTYLSVDGKYESPTVGNYKDQAQNFFVPGSFFNWKINDRWALGFGLTANYNLATDWSDAFPGRFVSRHAKLVTYTYRPTVAFKINEHNAIGFGLEYHDANLNLIRAIDTTIFSTDAHYGFINVPFVNSETTIDTHLRDQALGWNIAYMGKWDPWSLGITYHSKASFSFDGHSSFEPNALMGGHQAAFAGTDTSIELDAVPANAAVGLAWHQGKWTVEFDTTWNQWSQWDEAEARFKNHTASTIHVYVPGMGIVPVKVPVVEDETFVFHWRDTWCFRLGFGYQMNDKWELRWGVLFDQAPVPDQTTSPVLPDQDRWSVQFGTGYKNKNWGWDWYIMYLNSGTGDITQSNIYRYNDNGLYTYPMTPDGSYKFQTWLLGFQLNYKF